MTSRENAHVTQQGVTGKWWVILHDCGASDPLGPFDTREQAEAKLPPGSPSGETASEYVHLWDRPTHGAECGDKNAMYIVGMARLADVTCPECLKRAVPEPVPTEGAPLCGDPYMSSSGQRYRNPWPSPQPSAPEAAAAPYEGQSFHKPECPCYLPAGREKPWEQECGTDCADCTCRVAAPITPAAEELIQDALIRLAELTEGEARALAEVISMRLGYGHIKDLAREYRKGAKNG